MDKLVALTFIGLTLVIAGLADKSDYLQSRTDVIFREYNARKGGNAKLSSKEEKVNAYLMKLKTEEMEAARKDSNGENFPPAMHFFKGRERAEKSRIFQIIRNMPKGAILHCHEMAIADTRWIIKTLTYDDRCYMCLLDGDKIRFHFWDQLPSNPACDWQRVNDVRAAYGDTFDEELYINMTMIVDNPEEVYSSQDTIWARFLALFDIVEGLYYSVPGLKAIHYQALKDAYMDNVQYMEVRSLASPAYDLDGTTKDREWVIRAYQETSEQFVRDYPDFSGAKIIYTGIRAFDKDTIGAQVREAVELKKAFPKTIAGFDLVGQEDPGHPLVYFLDELLEPSQEGQDLPYFFHAGETDWYGEDVDVNLIDALLLNTSRIGHGYAITKHPEAMEMARQRDIPLEISPISNQVLGLVSDLRNHPASSLMASDFPLVISSDDPTFWGALPLSHDFYLAFMGFGGSWADLGTLKQLATDSLKYSAMSGSEKTVAMKIWSAKWEAFLDSTISFYSL